MVSANLLQRDALDISKEKGGGTVTCPRSNQRALAAGTRSALGEPVDVELVGTTDEEVERSELADGDEFAAYRPHDPSPNLEHRLPDPGCGQIIGQPTRRPSAGRTLSPQRQARSPDNRFGLPKVRSTRCHRACVTTYG